MNTRRRFGTSIWTDRDKVVTRAVYQFEAARTQRTSGKRVDI